MKDTLPYLTIDDVSRQLRTQPEDLQQQIEKKLQNLPRYIKAIRRGALSPQFAQAMAETERRLYQDRQANPNGRIARTAGAYFANENVIAGSMVPQGIELANTFGSQEIPDWENRSYKLKLGPGITFIQPASLYARLLQEGAAKPELAVNYTAPFGTSGTRQGLADIVNARLLTDEVFSDQEVIQTTGCTEALELALEAISQVYPGSEILAVGFSYYTAGFTADQKGLTLNRVMPISDTNSRVTSFQPSAEDVAQALTPNTKVLLLTAPNNPTGESYGAAELRRLMELAKEKELLILFDAIFEEMSFDTAIQGSPVLQAAQEVGMLDQVIVVDSLSKRRGFAGARMGWLATQNQAVLETLENTILARRCNPPLIYEPIAQFEGMACQLSKQLQLSGPADSKNDTICRQLAQSILQERGSSWSVDEFLAKYQEWVAWGETSREYYQQNFEIMQYALDGFAQSSAVTEGAFNTFVKMGENIDSTDFMAKLMLLTGTYTQVGPCFGISEQIWREQLGLWARVSFATERTDLIEGLTRLIALASAYQEFQLGDSSRYPVLNIRYDQQV
jgi:aspartate/methionine/tyrosine aminotransferase